MLNGGEAQRRIATFCIHHSSFCIFYYLINIRQISPLLIIIQSITHDELIADVHAFVVNGVGVLEVVRLEEQRGDTHVGGLQVAEFLQGMAHGVARVDDVFHDDHMSAVQRVVQTNQFTNDIGAFRARIRGELDEADLAGDGQPLEQLGGEHEGPVEHYKEQRILILHVAVDLIGHGLDAGFDFCLGDIQPKFLV